MKHFKAIMSFCFTFMVSAILGLTVGLSPIGVFAGVAALQVIKYISGFQLAGFGMALEKEIWIDHIVGNLFKANPFMDKCVNADQFVYQGKVVHIPNAGVKVGTARNRSIIPASVTHRTDSDITFALDEFTSDPIKISNAEKYELSYDKRESVLGETKQSLTEIIGDWMLRYWSPAVATSIVRTTGSSVAAYTPAATGNRKAITLSDIKNLRLKMNADNIPQDERYIQLDAFMYEQLTTELNATQYRDFSAAYNAATGVVGSLYGFEILAPRSMVMVYTNAGVPVPKDPDAVGAVSDNAAGLAWQKQSVIRALGTHEFFEDMNNPQFYGDIYSAILRAGGRIKRADNKGIYAIVQDAAV